MKQPNEFNQVETCLNGAIGIFFSSSATPTDSQVSTSSSTPLTKNPSARDIRVMLRAMIFIKILVNFCRSLSESIALEITEEDCHLLQIAALFQAAGQLTLTKDEVRFKSAKNCKTYLDTLGVNNDRNKVITNFILLRDQGGVIGELFQIILDIERILSKNKFKIPKLDLHKLAFRNCKSGLYIQLITEMSLLIANQEALSHDVTLFLGTEPMHNLPTSLLQLPDESTEIDILYEKMINLINSYTMLGSLYNKSQFQLVANIGKDPSSSNHDVDESKKRKRKPTTFRKNKSQVTELSIGKRPEAYLTGKSQGERDARLNIDNRGVSRSISPSGKKYTEEEEKQYLAGYQDGLKNFIFTDELKKEEERGYLIGRKQLCDNYYSLTLPLNKLPIEPIIPFYNKYHHDYQAKLEESYKRGFTRGNIFLHYLRLKQDACYIQGFKDGNFVNDVEHLINDWPFDLNATEYAEFKEKVKSAYNEGVQFKVDLIATGQENVDYALLDYKIKQLANLDEEELDLYNWHGVGLILFQLSSTIYENRYFLFRNRFYTEQIQKSTVTCSTANSSDRNKLPTVGYRFYYRSKEDAVEQLLLLRLLIESKSDTNFRIHRHLNHPYYFEVTKDLYESIIHNRSLYSFVKSLRWDQKIFVGDFFLSITKSPHNKFDIKLRPDPHKIFTVYPSGVLEYKAKKSPYEGLSIEELSKAKEETSKHQSVSLVKDIQPVFGHNRNRRNKLVGGVFSTRYLINRVFRSDGGSVNRFWEFDDKSEAEHYFKTAVQGSNPTFFADLDHLIRTTFTPPCSQKFYNEVLARLSWDINTSAVGIFSDTFEARCIAIFYANLIHARVAKQYQELGKKLPDNYQVPILFYLPENKEKNWTLYDRHQQQADRNEAQKILNDPREYIKKFKEHNLEYLLVLENIEQLAIDNISLLILMHGGITKEIVECIYKSTIQDNSSSFEEYFRKQLTILLDKELEDPSYFKDFSPFMTAIFSNQFDLALSYLQKGIKYNSGRVAYGNCTPFLLACAKENLPLMREFSKRNIEFGWMLQTRLILIHLVKLKLNMVLDEFLSFKPSPPPSLINEQCPEGRTALHIAALINNYFGVKSLLEFPSTDLTIKDKYENTALHLIMQAKINIQSPHEIRARIDIVTLLLAKGFDLDIPNKSGQTPRQLIQDSNDQELKLIIQSVPQQVSQHI